MQAVVAGIGADKILEEADTLCADLREHQNHSLYHRDCAHGLGHGFMNVLENEMFESLRACDASSYPRLRYATRARVAILSNRPPDFRLSVR